MQVIGCIKGKGAIQVARSYLGRKKNFSGAHFRACGFHVSTVGRDEKMIRDVIEAQQQGDRRLDQLSLVKQAEGGRIRGGSLNNRFERFTFLKPPALPAAYDFWSRNATHDQSV